MVPLGFDRDETTKKVRAGVLGWIVGQTLGAPLQGRRDWANVSFYSPVPSSMAPTFGVDSAVAYVAGIESGSRPESLESIWRARLSYGPEAARFALRNLRRGLRPPMSGSFDNPFHDDASAMQRAPFWGFLFCGRPGEAAKWAYWDASLDHAGDAVWACAYWAAATALAPFLSNVADCLEGAEAALPSNTGLREVGSGVRSMHASGCDWQDGRSRILELWGGVIPEEALAAHGFASLASLYGGGDFRTTARIAAGCGGSAIEACGCACALAAASSGEVPPDWLAPLGEALVVTAAVTEANLPQTLDAFCARVIQKLELLAGGGEALWARVPPPDEAPVPHEDVPTTETTAVPVATPTAAAPTRQPVGDYSEVQALHGRSRDLSCIANDVIRVCVQYPDGPTVGRADTCAAAVSVENQSAEDLLIDLQIAAPKGWTVAHRGQKTRIEPGEAHSFGVVAKPPTHQEETPVTLSILVGNLEHSAPFFAPQVWWVTGPFANEERQGYTKAYSPEIVTDPDAVFGGRSDLVCKWERRRFQGCKFDLEPYFMDAPGVLYLTTRAKFEPGNYRMVLASPVGHVVWIDGAKAAWYQDTHRPYPVSKPPYSIEFSTEGETTILIKSLRNKSRVLPTWLYFLDAAGNIVEPIGFSQPGRAASVVG